MRIKIEYLDCGRFGCIIDCDAPKILCPFCKERVVAFSEIKDVTPEALYDLLKHNNNKIINVI